MYRFVQFAILMSIMYSLMILYDFVKPKKHHGLLNNKRKHIESDTIDNSQYIRTQLWSKHAEPFTLQKINTNLQKINDNNDPTFLGIKNSAQISILNGQMNKQINDLISLKSIVTSLQETVNKNKNQINDLGQNIEVQLNNL